mmetsp:Transcript_44085/g.113463  ORF Transcript_44085/g.113463 Transcript_44085/m.113463 type:complete len:261 (-) Transcript_44085:1896-2678(-)
MTLHRYCAWHHSVLSGGAGVLAWRSWASRARARRRCRRGRRRNPRQGRRRSAGRGCRPQRAASERLRHRWPSDSAARRPQRRRPASPYRFAGRGSRPEPHPPGRAPRVFRKAAAQSRPCGGSAPLGAGVGRTCALAPSADAAAPPAATAGAGAAPRAAPGPAACPPAPALSGRWRMKMPLARDRGGLRSRRTPPRSPPRGCRCRPRQSGAQHRPWAPHLLSARKPVAAARPPSSGRPPSRSGCPRSSASPRPRPLPVCIL